MPRAPEPAQPPPPNLVPAPPLGPETLVAGRYVLYDEIGAGGMATVHLGRQIGAEGFSRTVAVKRLHPNVAKDSEFVTMFMDEAWLAGRVRHPNVVSTLDVVRHGSELLLVMEYVPGETLLGLLRAADAANERLSPSIVASIFSDVLNGLHAAHEAVGEDGQPLHVVHRDVSPTNIIVGSDGIARVLDFGVAKAVGRMHTTNDGQIKGKVSYMSPEQLRGQAVDRRTDTYASAVSLWECLAGERLFLAETQLGTMTRVLEQRVRPPSEVAAGIGPELDAVVMRGLAREPKARYPTASDMVDALVAAVRPATAAEVRACIERLVPRPLAERARRVAALEKLENGPLTPLLASAPAKRRVAWPLAAALAVAALAAASWGLVRLRHPNAEAAIPAPPSAEIAATSATRESPSAEALAQPGPQVDAGVTAIAPKRPTRPPTTRTTKDCDPPYRLDAKGIRRPKPECL